MKTFTFRVCLFCAISMATACKHDHTIILKGNISGLTSKCVYLFNNYPIGSPAIDSTKVTNGKFEFRLRNDTIFQPRLAFLQYLNENHKRVSLSIINPYEQGPKGHALYQAFILEEGTTTVTGDLRQGTGYTLHAGKQNQFYFRNAQLPFMRQNASHLEELVERNPEAYWALFALNSLKFTFNHQQLTDIFNSFNIDLQQSYEGKKLKYFIEQMPENTDRFSAFEMLNERDQYASIIDTSKKVNIIIFWASWCHPCRMEIPSLKKLSVEFKGSSLHIASVSMDKNKAAWHKALSEEKMMWPQFITPDYNKTTANYNIASIPKVYFVNNKYQIYSIIDGFNLSNEDKIRARITEYLRR